MLLISSPSLACFTARVMARHTFCTRTWRAVANVRSPPRCLRERIRAAWRAPSSLAAAMSSCSAVSMSKGAIVAAHERRYEARVSRASGGTKSVEYAARSFSVAFTTIKAGLRGMVTRSRWP